MLTTRREKVFGPMEKVVTQITNPNIVLQTVAIQKTYLSDHGVYPKTVTRASAVMPKPKKSKLKSVYNNYSNKTSEILTY